MKYLIGYGGDASLILSYLWELDAGTITTGSSTAQDIGITYDMAGTYEITLTVTDLDGCTASESFEVNVEPVLSNPVVECGGDPS